METHFVLHVGHGNAPRLLRNKNLYVEYSAKLRRLQRSADKNGRHSRLGHLKLEGFFICV